MTLNLIAGAIVAVKAVSGPGNAILRDAPAIETGYPGLAALLYVQIWNTVCATLAQVHAEQRVTATPSDASR